MGNPNDDDELVRQALAEEQDEDECEHEDYEIDILDCRARCNMCRYTWTATDKQMERHEELMREEDADRRYWDRVDQGRQQAKDREIDK